MRTPIALLTKPTSCGLLLSCCLLMSHAAHAARLALVVGNDEYTQIPQLKNAGNDARLMASALRKAGFDVIEHFNLNRTQLFEVVDGLQKRLHKGDEVVFYFSGHGVQLENDPLLLPVDIHAADEKKLKRDALPLLYVQDALQDARVSLLVIDACRDNPFPKQGTRSIGDARGLKPPEVAKGQAIIMSAGRNQQALDSVPHAPTQANGLFTHEFVRIMSTPGLDVRTALIKVRDEVEDKAARINHPQRPSLIDDLRGNFYLTIHVTATPDPAMAASVQQMSQGQIERDFWNSIKDSQDRADFEAYLQQYPKGSFVLLARNRLKALAVVTAAQPSPAPATRVQAPIDHNNNATVAIAAPPPVQVPVPVSPPTAAPAIVETIDNRYQVLGNGSEIKDLHTNLIWQRCQIGQTWNGAMCIGMPREFTFDQAQQQQQQLTVGGWRMPTIRELSSLTECSSGKMKFADDVGDGGLPIKNGCDGHYTSPTIHAKAFPNTPASSVWSGSLNAVNSRNAWYVGFNNGFSNLSYRGNAGGLRLVRGGQAF